MADVWSALRPRLDAFEAGLREWIPGHTDDAPAILRDAMTHSLFAGGKRLRPMLCGLACEAVGGRFEQAAVAGFAVEMIHTYSLIHDDLPDMDDDDLRRGRPTCHKVFGNALAILAGDGLQALAFGALATGYRPEVAAVMVTELARGAGPGGMVGGQVLDLIEDGRVPGGETGRPPIDRLEAIHRRKTGALFRSSLLLGAYAALESGWPGNEEFERRLAWLREYAESFGLLFQVTDDLLDVEGSAAVTGKATGKDGQRGKLTYPGEIGVAASRETAGKLAEECAVVAGRFGERGLLLGELAHSMVERTH